MVPVTTLRTLIHSMFKAYVTGHKHRFTKPTEVICIIPVLNQFSGQYVQRRYWEHMCINQLLLTFIQTGKSCKKLSKSNLSNYTWMCRGSLWWTVGPDLAENLQQHIKPKVTTAPYSKALSDSSNRFNTTASFQFKWYSHWNVQTHWEPNVQDNDL